MSKLLGPDGRPIDGSSPVPVQQSRSMLGGPPAAQASVELRLPMGDIPSALREDLDHNPSLVPQFFQAVGTAIVTSLRDPVTQPRILPPAESMLKDWVHLCFKTLIIMRREMGFSLARCFSILPQRFNEALRQGKRTEDVAEKTETRSNAWVPDPNARQTEVVSTEPMREDDHSPDIAVDIPED